MQSCAIAEAFPWVKVAQQHERHSNPEMKLRGSNARHIQGVQVFHRIFTQVFIIRAGGVHTVKDCHISREGLDDQGINLINLYIPCTKDRPLQEVGIWQSRTILDIGIDLLNEGSQGCRLQLHMSRDGKGVVQGQVPAMSNMQKPVCKLNAVCIRPVHPHVLSEMQDLNMLP